MREINKEAHKGYTMTINEFKAISLAIGAGNVSFDDTYSRDYKKAEWDDFYEALIPYEKIETDINLLVSKEEAIRVCKAALMSKECRYIINLTEQDFKNILKFAIDNKPKKVNGEYQYNQIGFYSHNGQLKVAKFFENDKMQDEINVLSTNAIFNSDMNFDIVYSDIINFLKTISKLKINKVDKWQIIIYDSKVIFKFGVTTLSLVKYLPYRECDKLLNNYVNNEVLPKELNIALNNALEFGKDKDNNTIWINDGNLMATDARFLFLQNIRDYVKSEINTDAFHLTKKIKTKDKITFKDNNLYCNGKLLEFSKKATKNNLKNLAKSCQSALRVLERNLYIDKTKLVKIAFNTNRLLELRAYLPLFSLETINNELIIKNAHKKDVGDKDNFDVDTCTNILINESNGNFKMYISSDCLISFINACKQEIKENLIMTIEYNKINIKMTIGTKTIYSFNDFRGCDDYYVNVNEVTEQGTQSNNKIITNCDETKDNTNNDTTSNNPYRIGLAISLSRILNGYTDVNEIHRLVKLKNQSLSLQNQRVFIPYNNEALSRHSYNLAIS